MRGTVVISSGWTVVSPVVIGRTVVSPVVIGWTVSVPVPGEGVLGRTKLKFLTVSPSHQLKLTRCQLPQLTFPYRHGSNGDDPSRDNLCLCGTCLSVKLNFANNRQRRQGFRDKKQQR